MLLHFESQWDYGVDSILINVSVEHQRINSGELIMT